MDLADERSFGPRSASPSSHEQSTPTRASLEVTPLKLDGHLDFTRPLASGSRTGFLASLIVLPNDLIVLDRKSSASRQRQFLNFLQEIRIEYLKEEGVVQDLQSSFTAEAGSRLFAPSNAISVSELSSKLEQLQSRNMESENLANGIDSELECIQFQSDCLDARCLDLEHERDSLGLELDRLQNSLERSAAETVLFSLAFIFKFNKFDKLCVSPLAGSAFQL
jgi:hypothetical protein